MPVSQAPVPDTVPERLRARHPRVSEALERRGVQLARARNEPPERHGDRLATELMALYRDTRETGAYEALYELSRDGVLAWIRRMTRSLRCPADPADLLQDTFVNVYRYSARFRADHSGSFRVWVRTIGANVVRRAARDPGRLSLQNLPVGLQEPTDTRSGPAREAITGEELRSVHSAYALFLAHYLAAYRGLALRDRRALELVDVEGLSYARVGRILGVGSSNMKMIMFRARRRLAARLARSLGSSRAPARPAA